MTAKLILTDGTSYNAISFGGERDTAGEVVFSTGMAGYPESITDPSYTGQILILTYPLVGSYGIPDKRYWESEGIKVSGLVVSDYIDTPSHFQSTQTLGKWFTDANIPLLQIKDTRALTKKIREYGAMLGKIKFRKELPYYDPNEDNLVAQVSQKIISIEKGSTEKVLLLIDCGAKRNIQRSFLRRGITVITVPWNFDPFIKKNQELLKKTLDDAGIKRKKSLYDGITVSNGPGDPKKATETITVVQKALREEVPLLGICLGNQLLALAAGGDTSKLKYGHRSQNQPCIMEGSKRCFITTQNHGFAVTKLPKGYKPWFTNANDDSNEGIIHTKLPFMSVQFHPEATPGPEDMEWIFDYFLNRIRK